MTTASRPFVFVNMAMTIDGKTAPVPTPGRGPLALSRGAEDPRRMRVLRAQADAIVIGASNAREDDPDLALSVDERARRRAEGRAEPMRVVVTRRGEGLSPALRVFDPALGGSSTIAHAAGLSFAAPPGVRTIQLGEAAVDPAALLAWLGAQGCARVLLEGGAELNAAFFAASLVDELYLTLVPRILGGRAAPGVIGGPGLPAGAVGDASLVSAEPIGDEIFLRYRFAAP